MKRRPMMERLQRGVHVRNPYAAGSECDPDNAYRTEIYNREILRGERQGSLTFAPGSSHVAGCPEQWPAIEARATRAKPLEGEALPNPTATVPSWVAKAPWWSEAPPTGGSYATTLSPQPQPRGMMRRRPMMERMQQGVAMRNPLAPAAAPGCPLFIHNSWAELSAVQAMPVISGGSVTFSHAVDGAYYTAYPNAPSIPKGWQAIPNCQPWVEAWIRIRALAVRLGKWEDLTPMQPPGTPPAPAPAPARAPVVTASTGPVSPVGRALLRIRKAIRRMF